jgi:hypothetical protein
MEGDFMEANLFTNFRRFLIAALIFGFVSLAAGCATTNDEWGGKMANEKPAQSVKGDQQRREARDRNDTQNVILTHTGFSGQANLK